MRRKGDDDDDDDDDGTGIWNQNGYRTSNLTKNETANLILLDTTKAFDGINRQLLIEDLR